MSANVSAVLGQRPKALTIPSEAVFAEGDQSYAYVVKADSTVTRSALTLGTRFSDAVEVVKGLEPGMLVVRTGHQKLFEGAKVFFAPSRPGGESEGVAP
jgi:multidrug efflux pump subunit AcrA (membrane-fusion protein)